MFKRWLLRLLNDRLIRAAIVNLGREIVDKPRKYHFGDDPD